MTLFEAIQKRQSVRAFAKQPLDEEMLAHLRRYKEEVEEMLPDLVWETELVSAEQAAKRLGGLFRVRAPHYLVIYAPEDEAAWRKAGIAAEYLVLYMTSRGIATCYQGGTQVRGKVPEGRKKVIVIAFGYAQEDLYRDPARAHRKPDSQLFFLKEPIGETQKTLLSAVRLAPSALNRQPWRFVVYRDRIHIFVPRVEDKRARLSHQFHAGIAEAHLMLGAEELWMTGSLRQSGIQEKELKKNQYVETFFLE